MRRSTIYMILFMLFAVAFNANSSNPWDDVSEDKLAERHPAPLWEATEYRTVSLDWQKLKEITNQAAMRFTPEAATTQAIIPIPLPDGTTEHFDFTEVRVMHTELAAKFPEIKTYAGIGIENPAARIRFDITAFGFHAMVLYPGQPSLYINAYSRSNTEDYICFYKDDFIRPKDAKDFECLVEEDNLAPTTTSVLEKAGDCQFRTYRLALSCTIEYSAFHGGTIPSVMSAMVTTMNRVNGIFERDAGLTMELVPNNDQLIFITSDNFSNTNGGAMLNENQTVCDNIIGPANYDIGHVFSTGGGGIAQLQSPCSNSKARGVTGQGSPVGDPFDVDYVAHEMGHQYGGNHTQNNDCNRNGNTAVEPGSASSIMGYAGICSPNVQSNSDDYFHGINLLEIGGFTSGPGGSCGQITNSNNNSPTADAGANYNIPVSTPFTLTGIATDDDGDPLSYCWEQIDNEPATMPPAPANTSGPAFRTFSPVATPSRTFPNMNDVIANVTPTWEVLPAVGRNMTFQFTVRDNNNGYGCTAEDVTTISTISEVGPFLVLSPNDIGITWPVGGTETVTWDVAGTDGPEVACANVDILLSVDGGLTYPFTLATSVPNNGTADIQVPDAVTTNARVMIVCSDNVFFDISNQNFTIEFFEPDFTLDTNPESVGICAPEDAVFSIYVGALSGFSDPVTLSAGNLPDGATATFSSNPVSPETTIELTIGNTAGATTGTYNIEITATSTTDPETITAVLYLANESPAAPQINIPTDGATDVSTEQSFGWQTIPGATSYFIEIATDPLFNNIIIAETTNNSNYTHPVLLTSSTTYYWRVQAFNFCGPGMSTSASFTTVDIQCGVLYENNQSIAISPAGSNTYVSTISIAESAIITDINLLNLNILHTYTGDLSATLTSPAGTTISLFDRPGVPASTYGCSNDNVLLTFDDESGNTAATLEGTCNPSNSSATYAISGSYQPLDALAAFIGESTAGDWVLTFSDNVGDDGGSLEGWQLDFCLTPEAPLPLDWLSLHAKALDDEIQLVWTTENETNNNGFEIYRSTAPDKGFELLDWAAARQSAGINQYSYLDSKAMPGVVYYYKIRQIDHDGKFSVSRIVSAMLKNSGEESFQLFPNPANGSVSVFPQGSGENPLEFRVFSIDGKLMDTQSLPADGITPFLLDIAHYPAGVYFVNMISASQQLNKKLVVE